MSTMEPTGWDHPTILDAMIRALPRWETGPFRTRPGAALTTRESSDPTMALLDCWATVGDVFSLYQQRFTDECYLGSATEALSVVELARAIGYVPSPGRAAETWLTFAVDDPMSTGHPLRIPAGTRVRSVPPGGAEPVVFETTADLLARPEHGDLRPITHRPQRLAVWDTGNDRVLVRTWFEPGPGIDGELVARESVTPVDFELPDSVGDYVMVEPVDRVWIGGITTRMEPGARLLFVGREGMKVEVVLRTVVAAEVEAVHDRTRVDLEPISYTVAVSLGSKISKTTLAAMLAMNATEKASPQPAAVSDAAEVGALMVGTKISESSLSQATKGAGLSLGHLNAAMMMVESMRARGRGGIFHFAHRVGCFGHSAPKYSMLSSMGGLSPTNWDSAPPTIWSDSEHDLLEWTESGNEATIRLERAVSDLEPGSWVVLEGRPQGTLSYSINPSVPAVDVEPHGWVLGGSTTLAKAEGFSYAPANGQPPYLAEPVDTVKPVQAVEVIHETIGPLPFNAYRVAAVRERSVADFAQSGRITELRLEKPNGSSISVADRSDSTSVHGYQFRTAVVSVVSRPLRSVPAPEDEPVGGIDGVHGAEEGRVIMLGRAVAGLEPGRRIVITGRPVNEQGAVAEVTRSELATVAHVEHVNGYTTLFLERPIARRYARDSVRIDANVAPAGHGETQRYPLQIEADEAGARAWLRHGPLTHVGDPTDPRGASPALALRVEGVPWSRVPTLFGRGVDPVFEIRHHGDGRVTLGFGDGRAGARPPERAGAVVVEHRVGLGPAGNIDAHTLKVLLDRPMGVRDVSNPLPAEGGVEPASASRLRDEAPRSVRVLERVVSIADVEDFACGFDGVAKASAVGLWWRGTWVAHLSACDEDGRSLEPALVERLLAVLREHSDPELRVRVGGVERVEVRLRLALAVEATARRAEVEDAVRSHLREVLGVGARPLARALSVSEVLDLVHDVAGVRAAVVRALHRADEKVQLHDVVPGRAVRLQGAEILDAELVTLDEGPEGLALEELGS